jgi:hypothetical protein
MMIVMIVAKIMEDEGENPEASAVVFATLVNFCFNDFHQSGWWIRSAPKLVYEMLQPRVFGF